MGKVYLVSLISSFVLGSTKPTSHGATPSSSSSPPRYGSRGSSSWPGYRSQGTSGGSTGPSGAAGGSMASTTGSGSCTASATGSGSFSAVLAVTCPAASIASVRSMFLRTSAIFLGRYLSFLANCTSSGVSGRSARSSSIDENCLTVCGVLYFHHVGI